jgi:hypothetical protein
MNHAMSASLDSLVIDSLLSQFAGGDAERPDSRMDNTPDRLAATIALAARLNVQKYADKAAHDLWQMTRVKLASKSESTDKFVWATIEASKNGDGTDGTFDERSASRAIGIFHKEQYDALPEEFLVETQAMGISFLSKLSDELAQDRLARLSLDIETISKPHTSLPLWQVFCAQYREEVAPKELHEQPRFVKLKFNQHEVWTVSTDWMYVFYTQQQSDPTNILAMEALSDAYMFLRTLTGALLQRAEHVDKVISNCKRADGCRLFDEARLSAVPVMNWKDRIDGEELRTELWTLGFAFEKSRETYQDVWKQELMSRTANQQPYSATAGQLGLMFDRALPSSRTANCVGLGGPMALVNGRAVGCGPSYNYVLFTAMDFLQQDEYVMNSTELLGLAIDAEYSSASQ